MAKKTYAVMGATGHIGHVLEEDLLKKGHAVRAIGRDKAKLEILKDQGAEVFACDFHDAKALAEAFQGSDAVFCLIPPDYQSDDLEKSQERVGEAILEALNRAKIERVLNLSSVGAELAKGTGPIKALGRHEKKLNASSIPHVLHFRAEYFMENLLAFIPMIKKSGMCGSLLRPDLAIPMVATQDIGLKIAELLHAVKFKGRSVFDFVGPRAITMQEATAILGKAIGKADLKYVQLVEPEALMALQALGVKARTAEMLVEMQKAFNGGKIMTTTEIRMPNRGKTTLEEFAKTFAQMFNMRQAA